MRIVPINEAEAIIEPFWDGGSSEHPTDKLSLLDQYTVIVDPAARGRVAQAWCALDVKIDRAEPGRPAVAMERDCDLAVGDYDIFRVFGSLPSWVRMTVSATVDGEERVLVDRAGADTNDEFDGPFSGERITKLRLEFTLTEPRTASASLMWLGLSNRAAQERMEARTSPYTPDWPGALEPAPRELAPEIGIFFDAAGLNELREKVRTSPYREMFSALREGAEKLLDANPEADIGYLIPKPDRRWCRNRDMGRKCTAHDMELLAFVGLVDDNPAMSRLAARMALSAAHCDTWCESVMGVFPGATWHHRSFTEEIYCHGCALVLDWAGAYLTPYGRQIIRDAIAMKGLPRIESDFKRMEYIRHMNQGIVFSTGRIIGLLGLLPAHPRYAGLVEEAERDLHEMIGNYVHPDGGTLEGMGYWAYTFGSVMPLAYALARYHERTLAEYATPALVKTGDYALAMRSTAGEGTTYLGINDAHNDQHLPAALVATYAQLSPRREWKDLYAAMRKAGKLGGDMLHLIVAPAEEWPGEPLVRPRFDVLPDVGQATSVRHDPALGHVLFHLCSGPTHGGHFHQDKGAFILEVEGETLACDRGVTTYDHPEVGLIGIAARHNLLYPEHPDGILVRQPAHAFGGTLTFAEERDGLLLLASDNARAWEDGLFTINTRRVASPAPDLYLIDDEIEMPHSWPMSFRLNFRFPMRREGNEVWIDGEQARLRIVPLNWSPAEVTIIVEGIDDHLRPVNLLRLLSAPSPTHRLLTAVEVVPANHAGERWEFHPGEEPLAIRGDQIINAFSLVAPASQPA
ncbi:MAG: hypothetical protein ACYDCO_04230 [Armatimonadota bacterium]